MNETKVIDISSEIFRTYTYAGGAEFGIHEPETLYITASGSHRVVDKSGKTHRPAPDYVGISWRSREGQPKFVA